MAVQMKNCEGVDYYKLLNVSRSATNDEIIRQYRKLSLITHPDKTDGYDKLFRLVKDAKDVLISPHRRELYNATLENTKHSNCNSNAENIAQLKAENKRLADQNISKNNIIEKLKKENKDLHQKYKHLKIINDNLSETNDSIRKQAVYTSYITAEKEALEQRLAAIEDRKDTTDYSFLYFEQSDVNKSLRKENEKLQNEILKGKSKDIANIPNKLTSAGCAMMLISAIGLAIGIVWLASDSNHTAGIAAVLVSVLFFIIGYKGR